jgi:hypothetical protein
VEQVFCGILAELCLLLADKCMVGEESKKNVTQSSFVGQGLALYYGVTRRFACLAYVGYPHGLTIPGGSSIWAFVWFWGVFNEKRHFIESKQRRAFCSRRWQ